MAVCPMLNIAAILLLVLPACASKSEKPGPGSGMGEDGSTAARDALASKNLLERYFPDELNGHRPRTVRSENGVDALALYGSVFGGKKVAIGAGALEEGSEDKWFVKGLLKGLPPGGVQVSSDGRHTTTAVEVQGYLAELAVSLYDCGPTSFGVPLEPERCSQQSDLALVLGDRIFVTIYVRRAERSDEALDYVALLDLAAMDAFGKTLPRHGQARVPAAINPELD